jgi:hypothetical protein
MNKLTKIGVSALCGSLAAVSAAQAGSMSVTGGATVTHTSNSKAVTGNPLGLASALTFSGSGELDNGNAVTTTVALNDGAAWSAAQVTWDVAGIGKFSFDHGGGTGLDRLDDEMPNAWNTATGAGLGAGIDIATGAGNSLDVEWAISTDMLPDGMTAYIAYSPKPDGATTADKNSSGDASTTVTGGGWDIVLRSTGLADGLDVFAGLSEIEQAEEGAGTITQGDRIEYVIGAKYAVGSVTIGYQYTMDKVQHSEPTATRYYENDAFGISFNVNDDLALSYGQVKSTRAQQGTLANEAKAESLQLSYTMGGATISIAENSVDNASYVSASTNDKDGTTLALSLAF